MSGGSGRGRGLVTFLVIAAIVLGGGCAFLASRTDWGMHAGQAVRDQVMVWVHPPSQDAQDLADATTMTDEARRIFFASSPQLEGANQFNQDCPAEGDVVLGCYVNDGIYVYDVSDTQLTGTNEVTAAHEMLHAAYARLTPSEQASVDQLIQAQVAKLPADDPLRAVMKQYPADQQFTEWHSRLGTQVAKLSPALEAYYAQYFTDRSTVIQLYTESTKVLDETSAKIDSLVSQITSLDQAITAEKSDYDQKLAQLNSDIAAFNQKAQNGGFSSQQEYDSERADLVARSNQLNDERTKINNDVNHYNNLVAQLKALDAKYQDLYQNLDSTQAPDSVS